jgi:hypothetical protein
MNDELERLWPISKYNPGVRFERLSKTTVNVRVDGVPGEI